MTPGRVSYTAERLALALAPGTTVDREKGVISGVRVVGPSSRNGRKYPPAVLAQSAALFAAPVNVGHHFHPETFLPLPVPPEQRFGRIEAPRPAADGVSADLRFNPRHPFADPFCWAAEHDPKQFSFSPLMKVRWAKDADADGDRVAESILEVASVDIVSDGGTTSTIFESAYVTEAKAMAADAASIAGELETPGAILDFVTTLFAELKSKDIPQPMRDAILTAVTSALAGGPDEAPADATDPAAVAPALEFLRRLGKRGRWAAETVDRHLTEKAVAARREWADALIKAEKVPAELVTPVFVTTVVESYGNEARAKELIADRKALAPAAGGAARTTPAGTGPVSLDAIFAGYSAG
jgi:hypothetical protein